MLKIFTQVANLYQKTLAAYGVKLKRTIRGVLPPYNPRKAKEKDKKPKNQKLLVGKALPLRWGNTSQRAYGVRLKNLEKTKT